MSAIIYTHSHPDHTGGARAFAPGETMDAISVWVPDKRVLMPGDVFFRAFPNISRFVARGYVFPKTGSPVWRR